MFDLNSDTEDEAEAEEEVQPLAAEGAEEGTEEGTEGGQSGKDDNGEGAKDEEEGEEEEVVVEVEEEETEEATDDGEKEGELTFDDWACSLMLQCSTEFDDTISKWHPDGSQWLLNDLQRVWDMRRRRHLGNEAAAAANKGEEPPPASRQDVKLHLQKEFFEEVSRDESGQYMRNGFITKYFQTDVAEGKNLLHLMLGWVEFDEGSGEMKWHELLTKYRDSTPSTSSSRKRPAQMAAPSCSDDDDSGGAVLVD